MPPAGPPTDDQLLKRGGGRAAGDCRHLRGWARSIDPVAKSVTVELVAGGVKVLTYDVLILAMGSKNGAPAKPASVHSGTAAATMASVRAAVRAAACVAIVGGGPTGVDLAGEIATELPGREVHLVQRAVPAQLRDVRQREGDHGIRARGIRPKDDEGRADGERARDLVFADDARRENAEGGGVRAGAHGIVL